jgi:hypothetical protein
MFEKGLPHHRQALFMIMVNFDAFARKQKSQWLSKKRQMQGAQLSRNEAYLGTSQ